MQGIAVFMDGCAYMLHDNADGEYPCSHVSFPAD